MTTKVIVTTPENLMDIIREVLQEQGAASSLSPEAHELEVLKRKKLLTPKEVQKLYGLNAATLANKRGAGKGPAYIQEVEDGPVYYEQAAIQRYLDACRKKTYED